MNNFRFNIILNCWIESSRYLTTFALCSSLRDANGFTLGRRKPGNPFVLVEKTMLGSIGAKRQQNI